MFESIKKFGGILGINARNLDYVSKYNPRISKKFADNKLYTKNFLSSRDLKTAKLYHVINSIVDLKNLNPETLPEEFVIKPNHGYGGEGIIVIKEHKNRNFITSSEKILTWDSIYLHCNSILEGKYAISGTNDQVLIEEFLECHEYLAKYTYKGLPDIRVIVFNMIPVIAMLRLPTEESDGKANLHLGAIGLGIDIGSGKTTYGVHKNKYITKLSNGERVNSLVLPKWNQILETACKAQQISKIGFLAVDLALTSSGIKILELNARAGLAVQIANKAPLRKRLNKVEDLKVLSPEQGAAIGRTLFSTQAIRKPEMAMQSKKTIGLYETVLVLGGKNQYAVAKIDPHGDKNYIDSTLIKKSETSTDIIIKDKRQTMPFVIQDFSNSKFKLIISGKNLHEFIIDPSINTIQKTLNVMHPDEKIVVNIDKRVCDIDEKIKLLSYLKPQNLNEERARFLKNPNFSPQFIYKVPKLDFKALHKDLKRIPLRIGHPLIPIYQAKIDELENKLYMIQNIGKPQFAEYCEKVFGSATEELYLEAKNSLSTMEIEPDTSEAIPFKDTILLLKTALRKRKLSHWKVVISQETIADVQVNKSNSLILKDKIKFTENRLKSVITHEIDTHIFRLENGKRQPYRIFERGTANYLATEEGLAIYNQNRLKIPLGEKKKSPALLVIAAYLGTTMSFKDLYHTLREEYKVSAEQAWHLCIKVKRGVQDTSEKIVFTKDILYFVGNRNIEKFFKNNPHLSVNDLYIGKISTRDFRTLQNLQNWKVKYKIENIDDKN